MKNHSLNDQFLLELKRQKKIGRIKSFTTPEELDENTFKSILEIALFDILALLPVTLVTEESNIPEIVSKSVKGLSFKYGQRSLYKYSENEAKTLLSLLKKSFGNFSSTTTFQNN